MTGDWCIGDVMTGDWCIGDVMTGVSLCATAGASSWTAGGGWNVMCG